MNQLGHGSPEFGVSHSDSLMVAKVPLKGVDKCEYATLDSSQMCAGGDGKDSCQVNIFKKIMLKINIVPFFKIQGDSGGKSSNHFFS